MSNNDIPENKQKRLMSLNQDVLAVSQTSSQARDSIRVPRSGQGAAAADPLQGINAPGRSGRIALALGGLAVVMLVLLGVVSLTLLKMQERVDALQDEIAGLGPAADMAPVEARMASLESQLAGFADTLAELGQQPVVVSEGGRSDSVSQTALAQANARLRKLDIEAVRLQEEFSAVREALAALQSRTAKVEGVTSSQQNLLATLTPQVEAMSGSLSEMDSRDRLAEIEARMERTSNDIRSLYRMLEMGR
ncbi:hypothetical protein [Alcanivorax sp. 1008]|uniref:hypothetical protein n=1 Tax=Alcanivorax sp. 1008 TaxID=2816853 RepID=UPI001E0D24C0|nr:hypothetical protein [Alcanivorax sp. 1008]MCC1495451.1 hypothetical protein [Alcanivorax sp. 1008]